MKILLTLLLYVALSTQAFAGLHVMTFGAKWCPGCVVLDRYILTRPDVSKELKKYKSNIKVDIDQFEKIAKKWKVVGIPIVLIVEKNKEETMEISRWKPSKYRSRKQLATSLIKFLQKNSPKPKKSIDKVSG